jgi:hypothetical protein
MALQKAAELGCRYAIAALGRFVVDPRFRKAAMPCLAAGVIVTYGGLCVSCPWRNGHETPPYHQQAHIAAYTPAITSTAQ